MSTANLVSVVIVTWNSAKFIARCLKSVYSQTWPAFEVIVVDNASSDDTVNLIEICFPQVNLVSNERNLGFAAASNLGIECAEGEYVLIINPDMLIEPNFITELVKAIEIDTSYGSAIGKIYRGWPDECDQSNNEFIIDNVGHVMYRNRVTRDRGCGEVDEGQYDVVEEVLNPFGGAALYKRRMLEEVRICSEYFDPSFFAYKEDVDLGWRAQLFGWRCIYTPYAVGYHARGWAGEVGSISYRRKVPRWVRRHSFKNRYLTLMKNESISDFLKDWPYILWYEVKAFFLSLLLEPHLFLAYFSALKLMPTMLKKRKLICSRKKRSNDFIRGFIK